MPRQNFTHYVAADLLRVYAAKDAKSPFRMLAWGDRVVLLREPQGGDRWLEIETSRYTEKPDGSVERTPETAYVRRRDARGRATLRPLAESRVLKVDFVDVQQGDGAVIESPFGEVILVDGGDNQLFARYLANRFWGSSPESPQEIDCLLVTHGDADHFEGLARVFASETDRNLAAHKRLFLKPRRVYHNGLVKAPGREDGRTVPDGRLLGRTVPPFAPGVGHGADKPVIVELYEDLLAEIPAADVKRRMNVKFQAWRKALEGWDARKRAQDGADAGVAFRRLKKGDDDAFDFFSQPFAQAPGGAPPLSFGVLGPIETRAQDGAQQRPGLRFLGEPPEGVRTDPLPGSAAEAPRTFPDLSASHTINGHSVLLRMAYGDVRFLFAGDLNEEAEHTLLAENALLEAEIFKVPHHGSADFSVDFLERVRPVVSVVSSGDESARKDYIHPRATLMGALGRASRVREPLIFVTELVAFFEVVGRVSPECHVTDREGEVVLDPATGRARRIDRKKLKSPFFAFRRAAFGLVRVRTDGKRVLVLTDSANVATKEAYAFEMAPGQMPNVRYVPVVKG